MIKANLRRGDGMGSRAWLRSVVRTAQMGLVEAGQAMEADGKYGAGTARLVRSFQSANGIEPSGAIERAEWNALAPQVERVLAREEGDGSSLDKFRGDLYWVHLQEGHRGKPYWPGGVSGVTLDPGVDLGHASSDLVEATYGPVVTAAQMRLLRRTFGLRGQDAKDILAHMPELGRIRISHEQALRAMPFTAAPYWNGIRARFRALSRRSTPPSVQTALLSLAYNRGIRNANLEPLAATIAAGDWRATAQLIGRMQQNHRLQGIRRRRREEAAIIMAELDLLGG